MTIRVYVAGSSARKERARSFMTRVRGHAGMSVALDWIDHVDVADRAGVRDSDLPDHARARFAIADLEAVAECDALVVLAEASPTGRGMWVELGFALGLGWMGRRPPLIVVSGGDRRSIFTAPEERLVDFEVDFAVGQHEDEAFEILKTFVEETGGETEECPPRGALDHKGRP